MAGERTIKIKFIGEAKQLEAAALRAETRMEKFEKATGKLSAAAGRLASATKVMIAPGAPAALASLAVPAIGLAGTLAAAGAAAGVFGAVTKSAMKEVSEASTKVKDLNDKVALYGREAEIQKKRGEDNEKTLKKQSDAALELQARLSLLPAPVRAATVQYLGMQNAWNAFVDKNKPAVFGIMASGYSLIRKNVGKLQPLFDVGARAASNALGALTRFADGGGIDRLVNFLARNAGSAFENLQRIATNVFSFIGSLFDQTETQGRGFLEVLADGSEKLARFGDGGGLKKLIEFLDKGGGAAGQALVQIGQAAIVIAQALGPLAPITVAVATALAAIIAALPPAVITTLVGAWIAYTVALAGYNAVVTVVAAATKAWAAVQTALNFVMNANPIGLIIIGIGLLIAGIVLIATKTQFFQTIWAAVWGFIKSAAGAVADWFTGTIVPSFKRAFDQMMSFFGAVGNFFKSVWNIIVDAVKFAYNWYVSYIKLIINVIKTIVTAVAQVNAQIKEKFVQFVAYIAQLPGKVTSAARGLFDGIKNSFKSAINWIIDKWNNLSFSLPSISTPFGKLGGATLSTPNIPRLAAGGWMQPGRTYLTGERGPELISSGRRSFVSNAGDTAALGEPPVVHVYIGDRELTDIVDVQIDGRDRQLRRRAGARVAGAF